MEYPSTRIELQEFLQEITGFPEERVYFQPPEGTKLKYPCVVYELADVNQRYGSNVNYSNRHCYEINLISQNPDSRHKETFDNLSKCRFVRAYSANTLNHWIYRFWTNL